MIRTKRTHKIIAVFLTLNFLTTLVPINQLYASNNGPAAPEASSFEPVDATDMVNLTTGDFSYVLPLLNVPSPEGGYPLALSYHAGIGLDQEASWVGLGWNLNPGAINRSVAGVPDDWLETRKYSMMYNDIGVSRSISLGGSIGYPAASIATSLNYSSFKATGGESTYQFGVSGSLTLQNIGTAGAYLGTNGVGFNISGQIGSLGNLGLSLNQSFEGNGFSSNLNGSIGVDGLSANIDLSSSGRLNSSIGIGSSNLQLGGNNNFNSALNSESSGFGFRFPLPTPVPITIDFSLRKTKYWVFDASYVTYNGSLYSGRVDDLYQNLNDHSQLGLDSYESLFESDSNEQLKQSNFSFVSYDSYSVNAQGIGGSISPKLLEEGALIMPRNTIRTAGSFQSPVTNTAYLKPSESFKNFSKSLDQNTVHFYFENEYSSYLNISSSNWSSPSGSINYSDPTEFLTTGKISDDDSDIDGTLYDSYNEDKERLKKGRFVETFTNEQILNNENIIIQPDVTGFNRASAEIPTEGIGAFRVTALDGKTYHYSLPVYHKEQFTRVSNVEDNSEDKFLEQQQFEPYATHWLLTAVTGPDYIDKNGDNKVNNGDYGYWVGFEYGKWSDGFAWRSPTGDYQSNGVTNSYSWGIKEVYYLDKIETRTHTALFIKEVRQDDLGYSTKISDGNNPKNYYLPYERGGIAGPGGSPIFQGPHLDINYPFINNNEIGNYGARSDFWIYAETAEQRSLRLERILLVKNEDLVGLSKSNSTDPNQSFGGRLSTEAEIKIIALNGQQIQSSGRQDISPDHTWYGEHFDQVLNSNDVDLTALSNSAVKRIDFDYDESYPLGRKSSESIGKLTLNSVTTLGKNGVQLIPPYQFDYYGKNTSYVNKDDMDDWGHYKDEAMMWSLNKITNPLGSAIEVSYENDRYVDEYARPTTYFDHGLEFKFEGTFAGPKTLRFRNNADVDSKYHVDFTEYFNAGQSTEIDVLFWHFTNSNDNWVADVASTCQVQSVSSNLLVLSLPQNANRTLGRENENCHEKNWIFYNGDYNNVVDMTSNWFKEKNENSCERPDQRKNRARYKVFAQKEPLNAAIGGGVRVKELVVTSDAYSTKTVYDYTNENNIESGVTAFAPSKRDREIPYITELPSPSVIYEHVTTERMDAVNKMVYKKSYLFNVPKPIPILPDGILVENAFEITNLQDDSYTDVSLNSENVDMDFARFEVKDYSSSIGRLVKTEEYNAECQLMNKTENEYLATDYDFKQGYLQETFNSYKRLRDAGNRDKYLMTSSTKWKAPNVLSKVKVSTTGFTQETEQLKFDFWTGQVTESSTQLSDGNLLKTTMVPAYTKYPAMGSKADNPSYKNMLTQEAMSITEITNENDEWEKIAANITTWNPQRYTVTTFVDNPSDPLDPIALSYNTDVWRKHKAFTWDGDTDSNGYFENYTNEDDNFDWANNIPGTTDSEWKQLSEITKYNDFSAPLEVRDINNNYASTKIGYDNTKTIAVCNAGYGEAYFSGAEDYDNQGNYGGGVDRGSAQEVTDAHTGAHALSVASGQEAFRVDVTHDGPADKRFRVSVWAKKGTHQNTRLNVGGSEIPHNTNEEVYAGDWVQLNFYSPIASGSQVHITSSGGNTIVDDFRLHPIASSMTSYIYNEWDELTHILGPNNMATEYQYDGAGRLIRVFSEVEDFDGEGSGGFKQTNQYRYTYKLLIENYQDS